MDTNRCHRASEDALEARGMAIAVSDELHEREGPGTNQALTGLWRPCVAVLWQFGHLPAKHRASGCALETRGMAIAVSDESQEIPRTGILDVTD